MQIESRAFKLPLTIFSLAALLLAAGYLLRSVPKAVASPDGPEVTGGSHPYLSFSGVATNGVGGGQYHNVLFTVPNDRVFIMTGACIANYSGLDIAENTTVKVPGGSDAAYCGSPTNHHNSGFLANGQGKIPFGPGTQVALRTTFAFTTSYLVQGYLAHP